MPLASPDAIRAYEAAVADHARYPQYAGHWDGPEWVAVRLRRDVVIRGGKSFERGDITIAKIDSPEKAGPYSRYPDVLFITAYSFRKQVDTAVRLAWVERV
jgi:hypothetical protein